MRKKNSKEFWISNFSKLDVSLEDLGLTIRSNTSINLLDSAHYQISESQIQRSLENGSLRKKRNKVKPRFSSPIKEQKNILVSKDPFYLKLRSGVETIIPQFDELEIPDEDFAKELADIENDELIRDINEETET